MKSPFFIHQLFILLFTLLLFSCSKEETTPNKIFDGFEEEQNLNAVEINGIEEIFFPFAIGLYNDFIILCDIENSPHFFVYELPDFKFIGSFGEDGFGPTEINNPLFMGQFIEKSGKAFIGTFQGSNRSYRLLDFKKAISNKLSNEDVFTFNIPSDGVEALYVVENNNIFYSSGFSNLGEFSIYNAKNEKTNWIKFSNDFDEGYMSSLKQLGLMDLYKSGNVKLKPDKSLLVKAYTFLPKLSIYTPEGELKFSIISKGFEKPEFNRDTQFFKEGTYYQYGNIFLTDNFIYALNVNCPIGGDCSSSNEIHVFNWEGNPIKRMKLNESLGPASPFAVDEKSKTIYAIIPKKENSYFYKFIYE